jgi:hypothetical protein
MALHTPVPLAAGEQVHLGFALPNTKTILTADGTAIWDNRHGKAGLRFDYSNASMKQSYCDWLHDHFFAQVGPTVNSEIQQPASVN